MNLISNASAYSTEGSSVIVRASSTEDKNQIQVIDHGIGISAEDAERIFERFFRVDTNRSKELHGPWHFP